MRIKSLRRKFVQTLLLVSILIALPTLAVVSSMSVRTSTAHLQAIQEHIETGIVSKGKVLTKNHALALRGLALDNAFTDMQSLVDQAVKEDRDLVYGVYVDAEGATLAYCRPGFGCGTPGGTNDKLWQKLELAPKARLVTKEATRRVSLGGVNVFEVALPVMGESPTDPALGTIRYGFSLERMTKALKEARQTSTQQLNQSLIWLALAISVATLVGLLLSRQQAVKITRPVTDLTIAANRLADGDQKVRVDIHSGDELEQLGQSFNSMVTELEVSYGKLQELNRTLEQRVERRTSELAAKNRDMRLVLDNVDQGFITLDAHGIMAGERSKVVDTWFGPGRANQSFWEFLEPVSSAFALAFQAEWQQLREGVLPEELCISQLPARLLNDGHTFSLSYLPLSEAGSADGMLVVVADITEKLAHEHEEAAQRELMETFKRLMLDRFGFFAFVREAQGMLEKLDEQRFREEPLLVKRVLHTLKGNSGLMGLSLVAKLCHSLEDHLESTGELSPDLTQALRQRWAVIGEHVAHFIGDQRFVQIPEQEYAALIAKVEASTDRQSLVEELVKWRREPVATYLGRLSEQAQALAQRLDKETPEVHVDAAGIRLDSERWAPFFSELSHVLRNAVDHGIESAEERRKAGKPVHGQLSLKARVSAGQLVFEITDDGRGIDWEAIKSKAKAAGLPHTSERDLVDALCKDGLTTRKTTTQVSGRGIGMAALKTQVLARRGNIDARSKKGAGTTFVISFPLEHHSDVLAEGLGRYARPSLNLGPT